MQTNTINAQKSFTVPVETVYEAWTRAEHLKQWWQPGRHKLIEDQTEVKTGGKIDYRFENTEGHEATLTGSYKEVVPNELLDYEWQWQEEGQEAGATQTIIIRFKGEGQSTTVEITQENEKTVGNEEDYQKTWEEALEHLVVYLAGRFSVS